MTKQQKGNPDYLKQQKKIVLIRTVVLYTLALAILIMGYLSTKTKANLLTIVAVLGLLPACKSTVLLVMYLRTPKYSDDVLAAVQSAVGSLPAVYHVYLTSYKKNFPINCLVAKGNNLIGYTQFSSCDTKACEEHLQIMTAQNSFKNVNIKIFQGTELKKFEERLFQLQKTDAAKHDDELLELIKDISL